MDDVIMTDLAHRFASLTIDDHILLVEFLRNEITRFLIEFVISECDLTQEEAHSILETQTKDVQNTIDAILGDADHMFQLDMNSDAYIQRWMCECISDYSC